MTNAEWDYYLEKMRLYYKPMENQIIRNTEFRKISQLPNETFSSFCNSVEAAGKSCTISIPPKTSENLWFRNHFVSVKKTSKTEEYAILDQIAVGTNNERIRKKTLLKNWNLQGFYENGMKYESAAAGSY